MPVKPKKTKLVMVSGREIDINREMASHGDNLLTVVSHTTIFNGGLWHSVILKVRKPVVVNQEGAIPCTD